jgi:hypothetical protein
MYRYGEAACVLTVLAGLRPGPVSNQFLVWEDYDAVGAVYKLNSAGPTDSSKAPGFNP